MEPDCELFYVNSDVESEDGRRDGHTAEMVKHWDEHFTDRFDSLVDFHVFQLSPKLVSPVR